MPPRRRSTRRRNATPAVDRHPAAAFIILKISPSKYRTLYLPGQFVITLKHSREKEEQDSESPWSVNDSGVDVNTPDGPASAGLRSLETAALTEHDVPSLLPGVETTTAAEPIQPREPALSAESPAVNVPTLLIQTPRRGRSSGKQQLQPEVSPGAFITLPISEARFQELHDIMAPVKDIGNVPSTIKEVIQHLYDIQSQTHGFISETQDLLVDKMTELTQSLSHLQKLTSTTESPNNPVHNIRIAPEIVDYVDDGRNPDIFTREFVENVQRSNAVINGKQQAFRDFSQVFAKALKEGISGVDRHVDRIMEQAGREDEGGRR